MKYLLLLLMLQVTSTAIGQSIDVTPTGSSAGNDAQTFSMERGDLTVRGRQVTVTGTNGQTGFSSALAHDLSGNSGYLGVIHTDNDLRASIVGGGGEELVGLTLDWVDPFDETLGIMIFNDGGFVIRDNVVNFTFYGSEGSLLHSTSNSSGSTGGEVVSEMRSDPAGTTVLLTNPRVNYSSGQGARARVVAGEESVYDLFSSRNRTLKYADVTDSGSFVILISERSGTPDQVIVTDRFGNLIAELSTDEELVGATLSEQGDFLTIFSSNRVQVYRTDTMERLGSTSFRVSVNYAFYSDADKQIVALCGARSQNNRIANPEIHAIHLEKRSIARTDLAYPLAWLNNSQPGMSRSGSGEYLLTGLNRNLRIVTRF